MSWLTGDKTLLRPAIIAAVGFTAAITATVLALSSDRDDPSPPVSAVEAMAEADQSARVTVPMVDVVRIAENGDTMIAGKAAPGDTVVIAAEDRELGRATADPSGEWVFVPDLPFSTGLWPLTVRIEGADGMVRSLPGTVVLAVPERQAGMPLAIRLNDDGASAVLQPPSSPGDTGPALAVRTVDRDPTGRLFISGKAVAGAVIHVYGDNRFVGRTQADANGRWSLGSRAPAKGPTRLRVDQVDAKGKVLARTEDTWEGADEAVGSGLQIVPASAGWRITRTMPWGGVVRTLVFKPESSQILDPGVVYPGQVFSAP